MVNSNLPENSEVEKESNNSGNDDNGNGNTLSGCSSNDDVNPYKSYARRRKCNENVQICEKQKKRESYQRVSESVVFVKLVFISRQFCFLQIVCVVMIIDCYGHKIEMNPVVFLVSFLKLRVQSNALSYIRTHTHVFIHVNRIIAFACE